MKIILFFYLFFSTILFFHIFMNNAIKSEFDLLQTKFTEVSNVAIAINKRQGRIIQTANEINSSIREDIQTIANQQQTYKNSEEKIKHLQIRTENAKNYIQNIKNKMAQIQSHNSQ